MIASKLRGPVWLVRKRGMDHISSPLSEVLVNRLPQSFKAFNRVSVVAILKCILVRC